MEAPGPVMGIIIACIPGRGVYAYAQGWDASALAWLVKFTAWPAIFILHVKAEL